MTQVYYSKVIGAAADKVWPIVRNFGALDVWFPFIDKCSLRPGEVAGQVGAVRSNTVNTGNVIQEELLELSDRDMRMVYAVVGGDVPVRDYSSTISVYPVSDRDQCFVSWSATFDVVGDSDSVAEWVRNGIFQTCLKELDRIVTAGA